MTRSAILHVQFQPLFEQFHILGPIHSGFRRIEIQTSSATTTQGTPNYLVRRVFHGVYNTFRVKTLIQRPPNMHMARNKFHAWCIRQKTKLCSNQREFNSDDVWQSLVSFSSSLVPGAAFEPVCGTSVQMFC